MGPTHFSDVLLSNWQSAVAKRVRQPGLLAGGLTRPLLDYAHPTIAAVAAVSHAVEQGAEGVATALFGSLEHQAKAALDVARALVAGAGTNVMSAREAFARFGVHDPFWMECVAEFVEHYTLTHHAAVPYTRWHNLTDFVLPSSALPRTCRIAVVSDWGTGDGRAQQLLEAVAAVNPDILIHLGDIYYACTAAEANSFYENVTRAFSVAQPRILTLCGNHDMYGGAAPYYALLGRLGQPASFFCLRNASWQILAADTGYNDFNPLKRNDDATWVRDRDEGETYSELDWHKDKLVNAARRKTILLTHHPLFTRNSAIAGRAVNPNLLAQFGDYLPEIALWLWGHEHNLVVYEPFLGLARGRCVGASAVPVGSADDLTSVSAELAGQDVPPLLERGGQPVRLQAQASGDLFQLAYTLLDLDGQDGTATYVQFDPSTGQSTTLFAEEF